MTDAFNSLLTLSKRKMTLARPGVVDEYEIYASLSNYSRNLAGPEETAIQGREFVISRKDVESTPLFPLQRGDILIDTEYGENVIDFIDQLNGLGGEVMGYRVRTS